MSNKCPNFLYIGTSKAGSTWLYNVLDCHPDIYMAPGKGLYFFDNQYDRGLQWYMSHFDGANGQRVIGEVSHSYMYSQEASARIAALGPNVRLMVCLREPGDRAFSDYLDGVKNGQWDGTFEQELERVPSLLDRGRYAKHLGPYLGQFDRHRLHVGVFDELVASPNVFALKLFRFLQVEERELPGQQRAKLMPAGRPRSPFLVKMAKKASHAARDIGLRKLRGHVKTSRFVRNMLYRQYAPEEKPKMNGNTRTELKKLFREDIRSLDSLLSTRFQEIWG